MATLLQKLSPLLVVFLALFLVEAGISVDYADARSRSGGRLFSRPAPRKAPVQQNMKQNTQQRKSGFGRGLAGGLLGGALGAMLFGSLFGASGQGFGLLPILLLGGAAYFFFRQRRRSGQAGHRGSNTSSPGNIFTMQGERMDTAAGTDDPMDSLQPVEQGLREIRRTDRSFDEQYFVEIASDVFFQVQAGWMRRDLDSYRHLLGDQLAGEYESHFERMRRDGHINKLESIAIRQVEIVNCGSDGKEDFVTVLFTANLLDYTVDEQSGELVSGSMTEPVKFAEEWSWARKSGTDNWLLEGIEVKTGE
jgi:predicted lipid-binding transport protein (Tim44 family)